ncbi:MAG: YceD family protein [Burkholderiaceae bacterium]
MTTPPPPSLPPTQLDVRKFALTGDTLSGQDLLSNYERVMSTVHGLPADLMGKTVSWSARGETITPAGAAAGDKSQVWLHLGVRSRVPMVCQRCLGAFEVPIDIHIPFRFVADEATALNEDETCEEDLLVLSKQFNLHDLIEDELLMALPIVPKHDTCPGEVKLASTDEDFKAALTQKPNAFAALGSLKKLG